MVARGNPLVRWLWRRRPEHARTTNTNTDMNMNTNMNPDTNDHIIDLNDDTQQPGPNALLGRRIVDYGDEPDSAGPSAIPAHAYTTAQPPLSQSTAAEVGTWPPRRAGPPGRAYMRTPSPNFPLPPPPRSGKERAHDASDEGHHHTQEPDDAGILPTPDTEFNTFGRAGGSSKTRVYPGLARAASPPTAFNVPAPRRSLPSSVRMPSPSSSGASRPMARRSSSLQDRRMKRRQQRRGSAASTGGASTHEGTTTPSRSASATRSSSPSDMSANAAAASPIQTRLSNVPFTFGVAGGRDAQDRLRGGQGSLDSIRLASQGMVLAVSTLPPQDDGGPLGSSTHSPSPTQPSSPVSAPISTVAPKRFSFNLFSFASANEGQASSASASASATASGSGPSSGGAQLGGSVAAATGSDDAITTTDVNKVPFPPTVTVTEPPTPAISSVPASSAARQTYLTTKTTGGDTQDEERQGGGGLAPRPPSPAPSAASHGSRFHEMLEDEPDRASVLPPSPTDAKVPEKATFFQRPSFFGGGERSSEGLKLMARRNRPVAGERRVRGRVISVERSPSFELNITPATPSTSAIGLGIASATPSASQTPVGSLSKKEGKRKASDPESIDSESVARPRVHTKSTGGSSTLSGPAPSSFRQPKRIRLAEPGDEMSAPSAPSTPSRRHEQSPLSHPHQSHSHSGHGHPTRPTSRASTAHTARTGHSTIPMRAILSPRPASIAGSNRTFHMRDPYARAPPPVGWRPTSTVIDTPQLHPPPAGKLPQEPVPPVQRQRAPWTAWAFYIGFVLFPLWWVAALSPVRAWPVREKPDWAGWLAARDERAWRTRCRWMSGVALLVYIPLIALAAVFGPKATVTESS